VEGAALVRILAIDPGSRTGWCVRYDGHRMDAGTWDLTAKRFEGGGMRYVRLRSYLTEILDRASPDVVVVEEVHRHMGADAAHLYGAIVGLVWEECERREPKVPYSSVHWTKVKQTATGKGNAKKDAMLAAANARWKLTLGPKDENEADARWIAEAAALELGAVAGR
jgi:crossover junction endodeoxyribonuclease RuvC